ncbi:MAG: 23S rRNA (pseudouridine(1915)-N(3))-methyltransferase RlmH, partial [Candidatus Saccharimonadales bacterium]
KRLRHYHQLRITHIPDKHNDEAHILSASQGSYRVGLVIAGNELTSPSLAVFLDKRAVESREVSFIIGGPDGLPAGVLVALDYQWSFGQLTYPHDLAMVMLAESLYRASTISAGQPYHH